MNKSLVFLISICEFVPCHWMWRFFAFTTPSSPGLQHCHLYFFGFYSGGRNDCAGDRLSKCAEWFQRAGECDGERFSERNKFIAFVAFHGFSRVASANNVFGPGSGRYVHHAICWRQRDTFAQC